ncbi:MAG: hypothetical protein QW767_03740 [Thermoprotei archaeon]
MSNQQKVYIMRDVVTEANARFGFREIVCTRLPDSIWQARLGRANIGVARGPISSDAIPHCLGLRGSAASGEQEACSAGSIFELFGILFELSLAHGPLVKCGTFGKPFFHSPSPGYSVQVTRRKEASALDECA